MSTAFTALLYVLIIAAAIFHFAKPLALRFSTEADYLRRRNVWFVLTITAFLSPSFWLFALVAAPLLAWAGRKDSNAAALYLLLMQVIPETPVQIPTVGINEIFPLTLYRLLSFCVLIPAAWRMRKADSDNRVRRFTAIDWLVLCFGALQLVLFVPPDLPSHEILHNSATNVVRQAILFYLDVYVVYFVISRSCSTPRAIAEAMASFCLACGVLASLAIFESVRHWLLYTAINVNWGIPVWVSAYLSRENALRAQVTTGHAIVLGYLLAVAIGFWLYLSSGVRSLVTRVAGTALLVGGLLVTYSRGPWLGAIVIFFTVTALRPRGFSKTFKAAMATLLLVWLLSFTALGERVLNSLPFIGAAAASESATYRQRLAERAWQLIQEHPFFGDQLAYQKMEDLRQGEHIIDLVNSYAEVALFYGVVGLTLFVAPALLVFLGLVRQTRRLRDQSSELALLGNTLAACMLGTLVVIATCSFGLAVVKLFYVLLGLGVAFSGLAAANTKVLATARREVLEQR